MTVPSSEETSPVAPDHARSGATSASPRASDAAGSATSAANAPFVSTEAAASTAQDDPAKPACAVATREVPAAGASAAESVASNGGSASPRSAGAYSSEAVRFESAASLPSDPLSGPPNARPSSVPA